MTDIEKQFPGVKALDHAMLKLRPGTVHALMGENGAGKSTLMKCLFGIYKQDGGKIVIDGQETSFSGPKNALDNGVAMVHQELNQVLKRSVMENIWLGRFPKQGGLVSHKKMYQETQKVFEELEIPVNPKTIIGKLSVSQRQMVEIAKAVSYNAKILVLDEPTSSLTHEEVEHLFRIIDMLKKKGCGIIYISHKMDEILRISDDITVMRDGYAISSKPTRETNMEQVVRDMVGRSITEYYPGRTNDPGEIVLEVKNFCQDGLFSNISFNLRQGEILGVAGLMGAGRTEIMRALFGVDSCKCGEIYLHGKKVCIKKPEDAIKAGIGFITENRKSEGLILDFSISRNIALPSVDTFAKRSVINVKNETAFSAALSQKLGVRAASIDLEAGALSGGNQQKVVIAKWIGMNPSIIIMDEPTRGIDVGAKRDIYDLMNELTSQGVAIIMVSSELPEVIGMSDRILVIHEGKIAGELNHDEATQEKIITLATGGQ